MRLALAIWCTVVVAGCALDRSPLITTSGPREEDAGRLGPEDASIDAGTEPDAADIPVDAGCTAPPECRDGILRICAGGAPLEDACAAGCASSGTACRELVPTNVGGTIGERSGDAMLIVDPDRIWVFDTTDGTVESRDAAAPDEIETVRAAGVGIVADVGFFVETMSGVEYGTFVVGGVSIGAGARVFAVGTRPAVILSHGPVVIDGAVFATTAFARPASGGGLPGAGVGAGIEGIATAAGNGGGSGGAYGASGADGGSGTDGATGGRSPEAYGSPALSPLLGGSGGGRGAGTYGGAGGYGGGAIQISSRVSISVGLGAVVSASGTGGVGGIGRMENDGAGGGGGSGGAILLEAPFVRVEGRLGALGGGGGSGSPCSTACPVGSRGANGVAGTPTRVPAPGGGGSEEGGSGGAGSNAAGVAVVGTPAINGGGGGGGAGRIRIHAMSIAPPGLEAHVFPDLASGLTTLGAPAFID